MATIKEVMEILSNPGDPQAKIDRLNCLMDVKPAPKVEKANDEQVMKGFLGKKEKKED
jgi:hypothetical protein